ncbi:MAG: PhzF family phenazine biosynthesis protein [Sumerlaeia bacterium]
MPITLYQVDAFADRPFGGNPAAVCLLDEARDEAWMQALAAEMNLSETAFLVPHEGGFDLRWFTPTVEVDLCGHATLASAHVLWENDYLPAAKAARFHTKSGVLVAKKEDGLIWLNFPQTPAGPFSESDRPELRGRVEAALQTNLEWFGRTKFDLFAVVESEEIVRGLRPDFGTLSSIAEEGPPGRGLIVTAPAKSPRYDFVSRFFAPGAGIPEDPVTGSAHCALGPWWRARLEKTELLAYQASRRGGTVRIRLEENPDEETGERRVHLGGKAVTIFEAELCGAVAEGGKSATETKTRG